MMANVMVWIFRDDDLFWIQYDGKCLDLDIRVDEFIELRLSVLQNVGISVLLCLDRPDHVQGLCCPPET